MKRARPVALIVCGIVVVLAIVLVIVGVLSGELGRPVRWEIPAGYRGWIVVQFEEPTCPPLRSGWMYLVIVVTPSGRACTSSPVLLGWRYHRSDYVNQDGSRRKAEVHHIAYDPKKKQKFVFVGTKAELEKSWSSMPTMW